MAEQQRAVAAEEVDVAVAVHVPFVRPLRALDIEAVGIEMPRVVGDAAREQPGRALSRVPPSAGVRSRYAATTRELVGLVSAMLSIGVLTSRRADFVMAMMAARARSVKAR